MFHDLPSSDATYKIFSTDRVLFRLRALDRIVGDKGPGALDPKAEKIARVAMAAGHPVSSCRAAFGPFRASWHAEENPNWTEQLLGEVERVQDSLKTGNSSKLRFVIWTAPPDEAQQMVALSAIGLLRRSPRTYVLDSTDAAKIKAILDDILRQSGLSLADALRATLVMVVSGEGSCPEPLITLQTLLAIFERKGVDARPNFFCLAPPGSPVDRLADEKNLKRLSAQSGPGYPAHHAHGPLASANLFPLSLCKVDLGSWAEGTFLTEKQVQAAWRLAAFFHAQCAAGRNKITLITPRPWAGIGTWTKLCFEQITGGRANNGIKIILEDKIKLANYHSPKEPQQDRTFLAIKIKGLPAERPDKPGMIRRCGYPLAVLALPKGVSVSSYLQFMHYASFGLAYLRDAGLIRWRARQLIQTAAERLVVDGADAPSQEWKSMLAAARPWQHRSLVKMAPPAGFEPCPQDSDAPTACARVVKTLLAARKIDHVQLAYYGDTRYSQRGRTLLKVLNRSAERLFRSRLKLPVDVCEGPGAATAGHEVLLEHGAGLAILVLPEKSDACIGGEDAAEFHQRRFLATRTLLQERGVPVIAILIRDLKEPASIALEDFFRQAATALRMVKV